MRMNEPSILRLASLVILLCGTILPCVPQSLHAQVATRDDLATHTYHPAGIKQDIAQTGAAAHPLEISAAAAQQIKLLISEKTTRTPAQKKLDSAILYSERMLQGKSAAPGVPLLDTSIQLDAKNRLAVDIAVDVNDPILSRMKAVGATVVEVHPNYRHIRALVPAERIEEIAGWPEVRFIAPQREGVVAHVVLSKTGIVAHAPVHSEYRAKLSERVHSAIRAAKTGSGSVDTEGDITHQAYLARQTYGIDGSGLNIGVLSSGVDSLAQSQSTGDLGPVTVLPGQVGSGDEGTAMLEIVHDLAPGANLFFATAGPSLEAFADNAHALQAAGCNIILDDVTYFTESPFQEGQSAKAYSPNDEGIGIQAINDVTAAGAIYLSAAGNSGNLDSNASGTWEGDFADGGAATGVLAGVGNVHLFAAGTPFESVTAPGGPIVLQWADPLGASSNDYDLYLLSSDGSTIIDASTNVQDGSEDPLEELLDEVIPGNQLVVVKQPAAKGVFLHLATFGAGLAVSTRGAETGHNAAEQALTIAATPAHIALQPGFPAGPYPDPFNASNVVEPYSSDGPRQIFFDQDGNPLTPGNFSSTGGKVLAKPDFTAADGVAISGAGGFPNPFYGTSAAVPHAAAIAALVLAAKPALTGTEVTSTLSSTAIDIMIAGHDASSGGGIVMANAAVKSTGASGFANPQLSNIVVAENPGNGDGIITAGEGAKLTLSLNNSALVTATGVTATLSTTDPGIYISLPNSAAYPDLTTGVTAASNFTFTLPSDWNDCQGRVHFALSVAYAGGPAPIRTLNFSVPVGANPVTVNASFGTVSTGISGVTGATGTQVGRTYRDGNPSVCGTPKSYPGTIDSNLYSFDAYTFKTCRNGCIPLDLNFPDSGISGTLFASAYSPTFNSDDPSANYIGDAGVSAVDTPFGVPVSSGSNVTFLITDATNSDFGEPYTVAIAGCALTCVTPNQVPIALVHDVTVVADASGTAPASIDNGSYDPNPSDTVTLSQSPAGPYLKGTTPVLLTVTDLKGAVAQASANVTVVNAVTISAEAASATVTPGETATYVLDVTSAAGAVTFSCSGLPSGSACSFNGFDPVPFGGLGAGTVQMTINTQGPTTTAIVGHSQGSLSAPWSFALAIPFLGLPALNKNARRLMLRSIAAFALLWIAVSLTGCGGGAHNSPITNPGTPAGTYSVTVMAVNPGGSATTIVSLVVN
jgi:hypothetical protein